MLIPSSLSHQVVWKKKMVPADTVLTIKIKKKKVIKMPNKHINS